MAELSTIEFSHRDPRVRHHLAAVEKTEHGVFLASQTGRYEQPGAGGAGVGSSSGHTVPIGMFPLAFHYKMEQ